MHTTTPSYIVELPLRVNDQQNRFLEKAFELGRTHLQCDARDSSRVSAAHA